MYLKALEMRGFKSFPDKTRLEFGKGITAIVGPNGSGKSNISDAVKWVLGEMSPKSLRGQRMEDVIFSGTAKRPQTGFCEVSLILDNSSGELSCDYDEVRISRKYFRTGESEYKINEKTSRLKDIYELFLNTGIGREGYSVIGQGKISEVLSQKSEDRRHIFEEAAEISKYRYRKIDAQKKLLETEANLLRVSDIANEIGLRIDPLEKDAENAKKFLSLAGRKKELEIALWLDNITKASLEAERVEGRYEKANADYTRAERETESIDAALEELQQQKQARSIQGEAERDRLKELEESLGAFSSRKAISENDISHLIRRKTALLDEINGFRDTEAAALNREYTEQAQARDQKNAELSAARDKVLEGEARLGEIQTLSTRAQELSEREERAHRAAQDALTDAKIARAAAENAEQSDAQRRAFLAGEIEKIKTERAEAGVRLENAQTRKHELEKEKEELARAVAEEKEELENILREQERLSDKRQEYNAKLAAFAQRRETLEQMDRLLEGYPESVRAVMSDPGLTGICGPVSRLLTVSGDYVGAIETALGAAVTNIVVEDEQSAKRAIGFLKERRAGRATFLPLTTIKGNPIAERELAREPGYIGIASRLVRFDDKYKNIAEYLLGRTIVAEDIDSASQIARKHSYRFRVVTPDGQIINSGGSYTGGSAASRTGVMSRASDMEKLDSLSKNLKALLAENARKSKEVSDSKANAQQYIDSLINDLSNCDGNLYQSHADIKLHAESKESAGLRLAKTSRQLEEFDAGALRQKLLQLTEELSAAKEREKDCSLRVAQAQDERARLEDERELALRELSELRLLFLSAQKDSASLTQRVQMAQARIRENQTRVETLEREREGIDRSLADIRLSLERGAGEKENLEQSVERKKAQIRQIVQDVFNFESKITDLRSAQKDLGRDKEVFFRELTKYESLRNQYRTEYDLLTAKLWEEYELTFTDAQALGLPPPDSAAAGELSSIKSKIRALGTVNVNAVEEYRQTKERHDFLTRQISDLEESKKSLNLLIKDLEEEMKTIFADTIVKINQAFGEVFAELFGGGKAQIVLTEPDNLLECGIEIIVQPPGKMVKNISLLSGGEQTFTAIALYFAILRIHPASFYVFDEIEAALDEVNVNRFAAYLRKYSLDTQFIVITHRRGTMESADTLYGVTMPEKGVSSFLKVNFGEVEKKLGLTL